MADNPVKWATSTQVTLQSSGASMASNAGPISAGTLATSQHVNYPGLDFVLTATFNGSRAAGSTVDLYARNLNIDGTSDEDAPGASNLKQLVGVFPVAGTSATAAAAEVILLPNVPSSPLGDVEFFVDNKTNQTINAGWTLKVTPKTKIVVTA